MLKVKMERIEKVLSDFGNRRIVVIGDVMLDRYLEGGTTRISPEAPTPIVTIENEFFEIGGAGNVAANIASLGGKVYLFSFVGKDKKAEIIKELLKKHNIDYTLDESGVTIQKTRVISESHQLLRFDREVIESKTFSDLTKEKIKEKVKTAEIVLISDYGKGTITKDVMAILEQYKGKMIIDPKPKNKKLYKEAFLITPSEKDSFDMSECSDFKEAGKKLKEELRADILITRGKKGMALFSEKNIEIPTYAKEVSNVTGAGDTVIATLALALAAGTSLELAPIIANHAAGIVVGKRGTYSVSLNELRNKIISEERKVVDLEQLRRELEESRRKGRKIVWTNGCFDLLHVGHVRYLKEAKKLGDVLVVGLNSDESIRRLKGEGRPIQSEVERAEILSSLDFIDHIIIFPEMNVTKYLSELKPDLYVRGGDYNLNNMNQEERKVLESYGGNVSFLTLAEGKSTTNIIEQVSKNHIKAID